MSQHEAASAAVVSRLESEVVEVQAAGAAWLEEADREHAAVLSSAAEAAAASAAGWEGKLAEAVGEREAASAAAAQVAAAAAEAAVGHEDALARMSEREGASASEVARLQSEVLELEGARSEEERGEAGLWPWKRQ